MDMNAMVKGLPEGLRTAFGLGALDMNTAIGYFATRVQMMVIILGSLFSALLGAGILAKEEGEGTAEFLLTKPVSRAWVVGQKQLAVWLGVTLHFALVALASWVSLLGFAGEMPGEIWLLLLAAYVVALCFGGLGVLMSSVSRKARGALPIALGAVLGSYFLGTLSGISPDTRWLRWLSPFQYVDAVSLVKDGLSLGKVAVLLGVALLAAGLAFPLYQRKDVAA
jgi:ABC-2 type transport system permease protein